MRIEVECVAGYRAQLTPQKFTIGGRQLDITEVLDCWLATEYRYFKVRTPDEGVFILRYDVERAEWELTFFTRDENQPIPDSHSQQKVRMPVMKS